MIYTFGRNLLDILRRPNWVENFPPNDQLPTKDQALMLVSEIIKETSAKIQCKIFKECELHEFIPETNGFDPYNETLKMTIEEAFFDSSGDELFKTDDDIFVD